MISVTIPWKPRSKGRPRMTKSGHTYTPPETRQAEEAVRAAFKAALPDHEPLDGPIDVSIYMENEVVHIGIGPRDEYTHRKLRGDVDNYGKLILDSLNGVAWVDDRQIRSLLLVKL